MKKFLLTLIVTVGVAAFAGASAYAEDSSSSVTDSVYGTPTPTPTPTPVPSTSGKIDKNDPLYIQLKGSYETIKTLRTQETGIRNSIITQNKTNAALREQVKQALRNQTGTQTADNKSQIKDILSQNAALKEKKDSLTHSLAQAHRDRNKDEIKSINAQIAAIKEQISSNEAKIKALRQQNTQTTDGSKEIVKQAQAQISKLDEQINFDIYANILDLQANKDQEWSLFYKSLAIPDLADANAHFNKIIDYKKQIIDQLNQTLTLRQQIQKILEDTLASLGTTQTSATQQ